jgi:hypothetical protein
MTVEARMDGEAVALLDPEAQTRLRDTLSEEGEPDSARQLLADSIVALTLIGRHPAKLRPAALTIMPANAQTDLHAHGLLEHHDVDRIQWSLTSKGERLAQALADAAPIPDPDAKGQAEEELARLAREAEQELGPFN